MALPPPIAPSDTTAPADRRSGPATRLAAIAAAAGLVAGLLLGLLLFGGGDGDQPDAVSGGAADAAAGCQLLRGIESDIPEFGREPDENWTMEGPYQHRVVGAASAFTAAGAADREYRSIAEDGERLRRAFVSLQVEEGNEALGALRDWCDEHDPG